MSNAFRLSLAPDKLWQQIDPWKFYQQGAQFGFINIDLGNTQHPELEQKILDEVELWSAARPYGGCVGSHHASPRP